MSYKLQELILIFALTTPVSLHAQDPVRIDPQHNKVEYEDGKIRVIRFSLAPGEKSAMHDHPEMIVVTLTNARARMTSANGDMQEIELHAGEALHRNPTRHAVENIGNTVWEAIFTEFKSPSAETEILADSTQPTSKPAAIPTQRETAALPTAPEPVISRPPAPEPAPPAVESVPANIAGTKSLFVNGTDLAYIDRGQGQPIVLVHDTLGDYRSWARQLSALSRSYHVISYSRRYHFPNHSTGKEHDYTYEQNAKDLTDFIRSLNLGSVRLIGHGYGGTIATMVAAEHPELVKTLTISESGFENLLDSTMAYRSRYAREEIYGIIRKPLSKDNPEKGVQVYMDWVGSQSWANLGAEDQYRRKQNANALRDQTAYPLAPAFSCNDAKKIAAPTLLISGQNRSPNSAEIAGVLSACIPNAERATVPNSGPAPYLDNPDGLNRVVLEFFAKH